jgi:predicted acylesterase/phospholipase RssA
MTDRALVLGGGGITGIAWELGLLAGLAERDVHLAGADVALDRTAGVPLVEAVAASCAVPGIWPPVTTGGRRFIDGGTRRAGAGSRR